MIEIDGSYGEGGGQIVRTAVALSAVTGKSVRVSKIRQGRPKPGLAAQHARAVEALAQICSGDIYGVQPGSSEITFVPGPVLGGKYSIDIGTAGSITLLMQCLLPALVTADGPVHLEIRGGTDVRWSPTIDYVRQVFLPALREFGALVEILEVRRGYYPSGGGFVALDVTPKALRSAELLKPVISAIEGISHSSNLPDHVATRQAESAREMLQGAGYEAEIATQMIKSASTGSGIALWSGYKGASALGERGVRAETVGRAAAEELVKELASPAAMDVHLADQLIPYLAMTGGSITTRELSKHAETNIWTARHFFQSRIEVAKGEVLRIEADPGFFA